MPQVVGLDIGASAVRATELDFNGRTPSLTTFSQVGLPPGTVVDGEVRDVTALGDALKRLWQNGKFTSKSVAVGIAGLRVITRELDLPWVPDDEIDSAVRFQSEEVIPFTPDKTLLSAQSLSENTTTDGTKTRKVLVAAAHRDVVDGIVQAVELAGLQVEGVDLVSSALVRALVDPAHMSAEPEAIVSVGAGLTVIVVHQLGRPVFVRTLGIGGQAATEAIHGALDLPMSDSENLKRRIEGTTPQMLGAQRAVAPVIEELAAEIRNSIQYYSSLPGNSPVARVLVTGGGSQINGFIDSLIRHVGVPVLETSPLNRLDVSGIDLTDEQAAALRPVLSTSLGLILPEPNPAVQRFNLIPPEVLQKAFDRRVTRYALVAGGVIVGLLALFGLWRLYSVHNAENKVNSLTDSVNRLNAEIPTYNGVVRAVNELKTARTQVAHITSLGVDWSAVLAEISRVAPAGLSVTSFTGSSSTGAPSGAAGAAGAGSAGGTGTTPGATPVAGSIGTMTMAVSGVFPNTSHFSPVALWIDGISGSKLFSPPSVTSVQNTPNGANTSVTFQSTAQVTSSGSLAKNGGY